MLEEIDVLELVDRDRPAARAELREGVRVLVVHADAELKQVFEVDDATACLSPFVLAVDAAHQVRWQGRSPIADELLVAVGRNASVLCPLDFCRNVRRRPEAIRPRERVRDVTEHQRLRGQHSAGSAPEVVQLLQRARVERACPNAVHPERGQPRPHLTGRLVGEGHREDLAR